LVLRLSGRDHQKIAYHCCFAFVTHIDDVLFDFESLVHRWFQLVMTSRTVRHPPPWSDGRKRSV
jgi:hypothetical protein